MTTQSPAEYWENRYREKGKSWSGNVNPALEREVTGIPAGTALDLGCGEGGDALWLARHGWSVTAVDIAPSALAIGAAEQGPNDDITWVAADLAEWKAPTSYDLVSACFLHSTVELPREEILRRAGTAVAPGGLFVIVGHAGLPHWVTVDDAAHAHAESLPAPADVLASLFAPDSPLSEPEWTVITSALIERTATAPDGSTGPITDSVVTLRRN